MGQAQVVGFHLVVVQVLVVGHRGGLHGASLVERAPRYRPTLDARWTLPGRFLTASPGCAKWWPPARPRGAGAHRWPLVGSDEPAVALDQRQLGPPPAQAPGVAGI